MTFLVDDSGALRDALANVTGFLLDSQTGIRRPCWWWGVRKAPGPARDLQ